MCTANESFNYLNYYMQDNNQFEIVYKNRDTGATITFDKPMRNVRADSYMIAEVIMAIKKEMEELGWIEL